MADTNLVIISGNMVAEPKVKSFDSGSQVANFKVATAWQFGEKAGTEYHNVVAWGKAASMVEAEGDKGLRVCVFGRLQTRSWEQQGAKRYITEVVTDRLMLGSKAGGLEDTVSVPTQEAQPQPEPQGDPDDDLPF